MSRHVCQKPLFFLSLAGVITTFSRSMLSRKRTAFLQGFASFLGFQAVEGKADSRGEMMMVKISKQMKEERLARMLSGIEKLKTVTSDAPNGRSFMYGYLSGRASELAALGLITDKEHDALGEEITKAWNG